ncbi:type IV secretion system protein VirB3 [Sphingomonas laterariae]|uniref:Type IV secretion system protein VirB3 n=1 Tax=Edaphosphingomonas laterariae TaxID=861865 RepID=A0A239J091_9SPHN|nr:VirB3 family type IV secretion system protein [Sphingomonas laterariae]SNS99219.1 type IV secretion system protein VirB3 [Sphingomonas laterariae]
MSGVEQPMPGFEAPIHRALVEPIFLAGAPRSLAILNGTLATAIGLGFQQWLIGILAGAIGHSIATLAARRDPHFAAVLARHLRQKGQMSC